MSYTPLTWINNSEPALKADNLNHMETGIKDAHDDIASLNTSLQVKTLSFTVTETTGTYISGTASQFGKVVYVRFRVTNSAPVAAGSNIFQGTVSAELPRPTVYATSGTSYTRYAIAGTFNTSGSLTVKNVSPSEVSIADTSYVDITFTYITR